MVFFTSLGRLFDISYWCIPAKSMDGFAHETAGETSQLEADEEIGESPFILVPDAQAVSFGDRCLKNKYPSV
ncbi:MAG: hypothetical protein ACK2UM_15830 [Anaerolineales bacterium]